MVSTLERAVFAIKPKAWPKLFVPALLGQALAPAHARSWVALLLGLGFTACITLTILLLNDYADREIDALKRRLEPNSRPKTIADGYFSPLQVLCAGATMAVLALVVAFASGAALGRSGLGMLGVGCLLLFALYSLPPARLNYRGGGELIEALGVGIALPVFHAHLQGAFTDGAPIELLHLLPYTALALGSAIGSGLSDAASDRRGGKRTFVVLFGAERARRAMGTLTLVAGLGWLAMGAAATDLPALAAGCACIALGRRLPPLVEANDDARIKSALHKTMWVSGLLLAAAEALAWRAGS